ncbi:MAG: trigger factor, partial [Angelakisella sp.]
MSEGKNALTTVRKRPSKLRTIERGKDLIFTCEVFVTPDVELGQYKGIEVEKVVIPVDEADADKE